jgi:tetratricopeptide (TPR) repeat protein
VYFQQGDFKNALLTAQDGLRYSPGNPWLLNTVGISLKNMGDIEGARTAFQTSLTNINKLTPETWGSAYPGNDPDFYQKGFSNMKKTVENNLQLVQN